MHSLINIVVQDELNSLVDELFSYQFAEERSIIYKSIAHCEEKINNLLKHHPELIIMPIIGQHYGFKQN